jgi:hypothetical protein
MDATAGFSGARASADGAGARMQMPALAPVDDGEQLRDRDPETFAALGNGADSRLALCALDLRHVTGVQRGFVCHPFLAAPSLYFEPLQVRGEELQRIGHETHDRWRVPTVPGTIGTVGV